MFSFFIYLIVIIAIQYVLGFVCSLMGIPPIFIDPIIDLVLAFIFSWMNFRRDPQWFKNPKFHKTFCGYFLILLLLDAIMWLL